MRILPAVVAALLLSTAALAAPGDAAREKAWRAEIAGQDRAYSKTPHAMLKIQDSAYVGERQTASLVGVVGKPASWRFVGGARAPSLDDAAHRRGASGAERPVLVLSVKGGRLSVLKDGKPVD